MAELEALSVSQALALVKDKLEGFTLKVVGEVSGFKGRGRYAAVYFSLIDESAVLNCMAWMSSFDAFDVELRDGLKVEVTGKFNVYAKKGSVSFLVSELRLAGEGDLRAEVALRLKRLRDQGLLDESLKKPLPEYPSTIGVVTSPQGKAVHDVLRTLRRRFPLADVSFFGTKVEGVDAAESIAHALMVADSAGCDVILLVRGGGSYEDLMPFSSEEVANALVRANTPVVTGIGHEPDVTIADYVADRRASTPTAAAETVTPSREQILQRLNEYQSSYAASLKHAIARSRHQLEVLEARNVLRDPRHLLSIPLQHIDALTQRLESALPTLLNRDRHRFALLTSRMQAAGGSLLNAPANRVAREAARLEGLSPLKVLTRGYAAVFDGDNHVVTSARAVVPGSDIVVKMHDGALKATVHAVDESGGVS